MTTQNMYDDQHDADASVVGHPYTSETAEQSEAQETMEGFTPSTPAAETYAPNEHSENAPSSEAVAEQPQDASQATMPQEEASIPDETQEGVSGEAVPLAADSSAVAEEQQENQESSTPHIEEAQPRAEAEQFAASAIDEPVAVEPMLVGDTQSDTPVNTPANMQADMPTDTQADVQANADIQASVSSDAPDMPSETGSHSESATPLEAAHAAEEPSANDEEVRPFTSFFEEFRQAEEARQELQAEALSLFATAQAADYPPLLANNESEEAIAGLVASVGTVDATEAAPTEEIFGTVEETAHIGSDTAPIASAVGAEVSHEAAQQTSAAPVTPPTPPLLPKERPVSPLLRPATRLRLPRHGLIRHREEPVQPATPVAAQSGTPETAKIAEATNQAKAGEQTLPAAEQPRPTRRYRFDNRSSANAASTAQTPDRPVVTAKPENGQNGSNNGDTIKQSSTTGNDNGTPAQIAESQAPAAKPSVAHDTVATENSAGMAATPSHISEQDRRRRHGQERPREKEQTMIPTTPVANVAEATNNQAGTPPTAGTPATVAEVAALVEPEQPAIEVAPEDLPPLEYAELQKASPRRRRRHRTAAGVPTAPTASAPVAPTAPVAMPVQPQIPAATPVAQPAKTAPAPAAEVNSGQVLPAVTTSTAPRSIGNPQYSIVSGYTVNQMNQGNETSGPFMGPEPSPARGSVITRDGRTARAESQRSHVYPARSTDATISSSSVHQLASVLSQAIQTQTDRMVAELRRANQGPTNVSVSLPPMPSSERVGVFVDVANLLYSARTTRVAVDFGKLLDFLRGNRRLIRAHAYCPTSPQAGDEQMFLQAVKGLGYRITTKNYKTFSSGAKKADLDLDLCMDVVRLVDGGAVDCIVLVSGDSDFMPMLDYCSDHGVRVEVAAFDEAMSATLRQSCDLFINLSLLEEIRS